jgi:hypothetical protein
MACALEQCPLTDADIAPFRKPLDEAFVEKAASVQRRHAEAMARVLKGEDAAAAGSQSLEEAADAYLAALVQKIGVRLLDERFKLPKGKEVFL